ncbi:MAG TPA: hypothetical protein VGI54_07425 [Solirubrobacteraceae bacterium]|jgi:hypothetical protein
MSNLEPRGGRRVSRHERESRAYRLVVLTGVLSVVGIVGLVLALFGVIGAGLPIVLVLIAAALGFYLRRSLGA